jgi:hypothetical protein
MRERGTCQPIAVLTRCLCPWIICLLVGCLGTRLVNLERVAGESRAPPAARGWRADVSALFERYEAEPVLAPEDERLEPLFGGLTTLSYFGADAKPRVLDQQIPASGAAAGRSLAQACAGSTEGELRARSDALATTGLPAFAPVWIPLAREGGEAPAAVSCDAHGRPLGPGAEAGFCAFGRLALQPEPGRALILVVHGVFDSGAQLYVQRLAATLYGLGHSVLLPDLRDHGETLRAMPQLATTLGTLEGPDLLALVAASRRACATRLGRAGLAAVSGGGLAAIRALTLDARGTLDAGVLAISPLLDTETALADLSQTGDCAITRSIELSFVDDLALGLAAGVASFGGAAAVQALHGDALDGRTALAGAIGAGVGLAGGLALDAWFDGSSEPCVSQNAIGTIVQDALRVRWRALSRVNGTLSPAGRRIDPSAITLSAYMRERAGFLAQAQGLAMRRFEPATLARELRASFAARSAAGRPGAPEVVGAGAPAAVGGRADGDDAVAAAAADGEAGGSSRKPARLLLLGAEDDPMVRIPALREFAARTRDLPQVYTRIVRHGGHAAMSLVQPDVTEAVYARFFAPD